MLPENPHARTHVPLISCRVVHCAHSRTAGLLMGEPGPYFIYGTFRIGSGRYWSWYRYGGDRGSSVWPPASAPTAKSLVILHPTQAVPLLIERKRALEEAALAKRSGHS